MSEMRTKILSLFLLRVSDDGEISISGVHLTREKAESTLIDDFEHIWEDEGRPDSIEKLNEMWDWEAVVAETELYDS